MKKTAIFLALMTALCLLLSGCAAPREAAVPQTAGTPRPAAQEAVAETAAPAQAVFTAYSYRDMSLIFDTEITLKGYAESKEEFDRVAAETMALLREYDHIFDAYTAYEGLHNLHYVNLHAAQEPVTVPDALFELISWCKDKWDQGYHTANIAMGAVLSIWHTYRDEGNAHPESAQLPPMEELKAAAEHINFDDLILDAENQTVYFADPLLRLDIGAVAKGWAADQAVPYLYAHMPSFILNLGGNVYTGEPPLDGRNNWGVAVQDPTADELTLALGGAQYMDILDVHNLTVVTSGDYWRYYTVDGVRYHHIIDPETLMPSRRMLSVTVVCESSALADYLSTTLFILPYEDGLALVQSLEGVEAMWMLPDGTVQFTPGMLQYSRQLWAQ